MRPSGCTCAVLTLGLMGGCATPPSGQGSQGAASMASALRAAEAASTTRTKRFEPRELAWTPGPPLPQPRSNNAVALLPGNGAQPRLLTVLGLGAGRRDRDISSEGWTLSGGQWARLLGAPGRAGRLASTAQTVRGRVYVFGGYTVAPDGTEVSTPEVDAYDAKAGRWSTAAPMPVPVDDAVSGVWSGQVVLVSGWHDRDNVRDVQMFEPRADRWSSLPPVTGTPVFGHAGGVVANTLLYCDGVGVDRSRDAVFAAVQECHAMDLAADEPRWRPVLHHARATRYRAAAVGWPDQDWIVFAGGTARPYNYNGTGYDGIAAEPLDDVFAWDARMSSWIALPPLPVASMDHRGLVVAGDALWLVGGMSAGADGTTAVSSAVWRLGRRAAP